MKKIIIAGLIITMFLFTGCPAPKETGVQNPFIGGTTGILIDFAEDSPPPEVYAGGDYPFDAVVKLKNDGEYRVAKEDITVTISGINAQEFGKTESDLTKNPDDDLEPRRKEDGDIIDSNPVYAEFFDLNRLEDFSGNTYTLRADVCYKYGTNAISDICVKSNNLDDKEGVCTINEDKNVYSSSAPVQIVDFKETGRAKDKIAFTFTVVHKGNGQIFKPGSNCGKENRRANQDRVQIEVSTGLEGLECSGIREGGLIALYGGDSQITCTQTVSTSSDYEKPVEIKLIYEYKDNAETQVQVKSSGEI